MKRLKIGLLLNDLVYIKRLEQVINTEYASDAELTQYSGLKEITDAAMTKRVDLILMDEDISVKYDELSRYCAIAVLSSTRRYDRSTEYGVIYKYQHIDDLLANFFQVYDEHHGFARVIAFTGASGGCGCSTIAAACAKALASRKKKVLYINGESATDDVYYLKNVTELGISYGKDEGISNLLDSNEYAKFEHMLEEVKYDFVVMDVQNAMLFYKNFMDLIYELIIVESSEGRSLAKAELLKAKTDPYTNVMVIKNKLEQYGAQDLGDSVGYIPVMNDYDSNTIIDQISTMEVFEKIV